MEKKIQAAVAVMIIFGFFCGTAIPELFHMDQGTYAGLLSRYGLQSFAGGSLEPTELFRFVWQNRILGLTLLWMSWYTPVGLIMHLLFLFWLCLSFGILLSIFLLRQGPEGILLLACCILPQWIIYGSVLRQEFSFLAGKKSRTTEMYQSDLRIYGRMLLECLAGCLLETWFGLYIFQLFLQQKM